MHIMQYSAPKIYNDVRDLARHMSKLAAKHMKEILQCVKHFADWPDHRLLLPLIRLWDGSSDFKPKIGRTSDSDSMKRLLITEAFLSM